MNVINMKEIFILLIIAFTLTSCAIIVRHEVSVYSPINDVKEIEGYYLNRVDTRNLDRLYNRSLLECFNIYEYADFVTITFESPYEIKLTYFNDSIKQERIFKGQKEKNYFEIYFSNKVFEAIIMANRKVDRIRIGKSKAGSLIIEKKIDNGGHFFLIGGGGRNEKTYMFSNASEYKEYMPIQKNGLWGYSDSSGNTIIPTKYDFACIFEHNVARVKLNNKWGLINKKGEEITPLIYDKISTIEAFYSPPIFRAFISDKTGVLDTNGNVLIPVIYNFIGYHLLPDKLTEIKLGYKIGFATRTRVVIPAIYSSIFNRYMNDVYVKRDGKHYVVDIDGYEYETRDLWLIKEKIPEKRRKIQLEEQEIE